MSNLEKYNMPIYGYQCNDCGHTFDEKLAIDNRDDPCNQPCPNCQANTITRPITSPRIAYNNLGSLKTTDSFNDRLKEIKNKVPERFKGALNNNIR